MFGAAAVILSLVASQPAVAHPAVGEIGPSDGSRFSSAFVLTSDVESVFEDLLEASPTLQSQYDRITSALHVQVHVTLVPGLPLDRRAQTVIRRAERGGLEARVEIPTPLRDDEYAELLAHELEHVLEQIEGVDLDSLAGRRTSGVNRLQDGTFETARAQLTGRQAALEVRTAGRGQR